MHMIKIMWSKVKQLLAVQTDVDKDASEREKKREIEMLGDKSRNVFINIEMCKCCDDSIKIIQKSNTAARPLLPSGFLPLLHH